MPRQPREPAARAPLAAAAVVSQQLSELLLAFPAAASEGVSWKVLARKFEERHQARLDVQALGHSSPLAAASTLLWDVLRLVNKDDPSNIFVGIEDAVALTPRPGSLGCWPSLYQSLVEIVQSHGALDGTSSDGAQSSSILLSQIRPLLERHWHTSFDESGMGFLNDDGAFVRLKKLKHLLHAVLRWRDQRQAWRRRCPAQRPSALDEALAPCLRLVASPTHNDLLLVCLTGGEPGVESMLSTGAEKPAKGRCQKRQEPESPLPSASAAPSASEAGADARLSAMQRELERLRSENCSLRVENLVLQHHQQHQAVDDASSCCVSDAPTASSRPSESLWPDNVLDDPFEPPPEAMWASCKASVFSVGTMSRSMSDFSCASSSVASGAMTPLPVAAPQPTGYTFAPMWFFSSPFSGVDVSVIPRGIVQTARAHFESLGAK